MPTPRNLARLLFASTAAQQGSCVIVSAARIDVPTDKQADFAEAGGRPSAHAANFAANFAANPPSFFQMAEEKSHHLVEDRLPLVPYPSSLERKKDAKEFALCADTHVVLGTGISDTDVGVQSLHKSLKEATRAAGTACVSGNILLELDATSGNQHQESYELDVSENEVKLKAPTLTGMFYGIGTLKQLIPRSETPSLPPVIISDEPRFGWRGLQLDVSRHFFNATEVKRLLDTMSAFKLNRFHWHLTDDQGWRLPIGKYPKLTELGAMSVSNDRESYTAEEIKDVIAYAAARHIEVLPEVDVPGHTAAAIAAYPELGNTDMDHYRAPDRPLKEWGAMDYTLGPHEATNSFLETVFSEVSDLFPFSMVHIGGDEANTKQWGKSQHARKYGNVQSFFNEHVSELLKNNSKTVVAWDEAQHMKGLPKDAIIMAWRSENELVQAVQKGRRAVNANMEALYFDHYQGRESEEPKAICCHTSLRQVYEYSPVPTFLQKSEADLILGGQAQLWSEYIPSVEHLEYMAFPRALALAETLWTPKKQIAGFDEFRKRLQVRVGDLHEQGVNYRKIRESE